METNSTSKQRWIAGGLAALALTLAAACGDETQVSSGAATPSAKPASAVVASADAIANRAHYNTEWKAPVGASYADTLENRADQLELRSKVAEAAFQRASAAEASRYVEGLKARASSPVSSSYASTLEDRAAQLELRTGGSDEVVPSADALDRRAQQMQSTGEDHSKHWHR